MSSFLQVCTHHGPHHVEHANTHKCTFIQFAEYNLKGFLKPEKKSLNSTDGGWIAKNKIQLLLSIFRGGLEPHIFTQVKC